MSTTNLTELTALAASEPTEGLVLALRAMTQMSDSAPIRLARAAVISELELRFELTDALEAWAVTDTHVTQAELVLSLVATRQAVSS